jgi:hypothetical protein
MGQRRAGGDPSAPVIRAPEKAPDFAAHRPAVPCGRRDIVFQSVQLVGAVSKQDVEFNPDKNEPPLLGFVRHYWENRCGANAMPRRQDIAPADMRAHLRHILLADVIDGGQDFRYRLVGTELQRYFAGNPTGKLMSEALAPFGAETVSRTIATYRSVVQRRKPLRIRGSGALYDQQAKTFDALLAPLADDGETANMVFGTFLFEWGPTTAVPKFRNEPDVASLARALTTAR